LNAVMAMSGKSRAVLFGLILALLISCAPVAGATGVDGFMDIAWGASRSAVAQKMSELHFPKDAESNVQRDIYEGMFAARKAYLTFRFVNNVFYSGGALFVDTYHAYGNVSNSAIDYYFRDIEAQMVKKYGQPTKRPYDDSDYWTIDENGIRILIKLGKNYPHKGGDNSRVFVNYENQTLLEKEKQRAANRDF
jgi:hypothetical protein